MQSYKKYTFGYWEEELRKSKEDREQFENDAKRSINLYKKKYKLDDCARTMGIWWQTVNTLLPAYFSKIPKVDVELRKKRGGELERLAALAWENATQYTIEEDFDFYSVGHPSVLQFILAGQAVLWARYSAEFEKKPYKYALNDEDEREGAYEENGVRYIEEEIDEVASEKAVLDFIGYQDYRESIARTDNEISWRARRAFMSREQVSSKFGEEEENKFNYNSYPDDINAKDVEQKYEGKAAVWEIWCKDTNKVYFLHHGKEKFLKENDVPVSFNNFWPCVVLNANSDPDSITPFGDYVELEDLILEVERLTTRIHATLQAIRANFMYGKALGDKIEDILSDDLKGIPVNKPTANKTLADSIEFLNVDPYIKTLTVLTQSRETALNKLYEACGVSDLIRGNSIAIKTATANQLEANYSSLRFSVRRNQVARFFIDAIEKVAQIVVSKFSDEHLYLICFGEELAQEIPDPAPQMIQGPQGPVPVPTPPMPPAVKFQAILELLRSDVIRNFKLDIESDSLTQLDQRGERQERVDVMASSGQFLQQLQQLIAQAPSTADYAKSMFKFVIRSYEAGKEIEGDMMKALDAMVQELMQAKQQQAQDPNAQANMQAMQIAQMQAMTEEKKLQANLTVEQAKLASDAEDRMLKAQELAVKAEEARQDHAVELGKLQIEFAKLKITEEDKAANIQLKAMSEAFDQDLKTAYLRLDEFGTVAKENEKLIEEKRLAGKERIENLKFAISSMKDVNRADTTVERRMNDNFIQ